jgi:PAP2 superfamily C-terminal
MELILIPLGVLLIFFSNYLTNRLGENHYRESNEIYDLFFSYLPDLHPYESTYSVTFGIFLILSFLLLNFSNKKEFATKLFIIFLIRAITIPTTILPPSYSSCDFDSFVSTVNGGCYDRIFSGHTAAGLLMTIFLVKQGILNLSTAILLNVVNIFAILSTRAHYSIDIVIALFITYFVNDQKW